MGYYTEAAAKEHVEALCRLGEMYLKGIGYVADKVMAETYLRKAAEKNSIQAQTLLEQMQQA